MDGSGAATCPRRRRADASARTLELAKKTQNPIADLISLPLQNNLNFGYGAKDAPHSSSTQYVLNIQPVVPITVAKGWNLITRPIIPVIRQPDLIDGGETWGLADIQLPDLPVAVGDRQGNLGHRPRASRSRARPTAGSSAPRSGAPGRAWSC